jgi:hypothetical protein
MINHGHCFGLTAGFLLLCLALSTAAFAKDPTYTQWGHDISIGPHDKTADLTCIGCSIHVRGEVAGDVTTVGGSITIEDQGQVAGDVTSVAGNVRLDREVKVSGDVTVVAGTLHRDLNASVGGDVTSMEGRGWFALILLTPIVILGLMVGLLIWLIQRVRRPPVHAAAA